MKAETVLWIIDEWLQENWSKIISNNLEIYIKYGRDSYLLDLNGFTRFDEDGFTYVNSELSDFDREIICRMLPEFMEKIKIWIE